MTERERWVVYPLLFLALGASLRDKLIDRTIARSIYCQELAIVDEEPRSGQSARILARIGRDENKSAGPASAHFRLDGRMEIDGRMDIISEDASGIHRHVRMGRTDAQPGAPTFGELVVGGVINARQYLFQDMPMIPSLSLPGFISPDQLRALQQMQKQQRPKAPAAAPKSRDPQTPPPAAKQETKAAPPAPADQKAEKPDAPK